MTSNRIAGAAGIVLAVLWLVVAGMQSASADRRGDGRFMGDRSVGRPVARMHERGSWQRSPAVVGDRQPARVFTRPLNTAITRRSNTYYRSWPNNVIVRRPFVPAFGPTYFAPLGRYSVTYYGGYNQCRVAYNQGYYDGGYGYPPRYNFGSCQGAYERGYNDAVYGY